LPLPGEQSRHQFGSRALCLQLPPGFTFHYVPFHSGPHLRSFSTENEKKKKKKKKKKDAEPEFWLITVTSH
jgi:hypothetical protein